MTPFSNEPVLELRRGEVRASLHEGLAKLDALLPLDVPAIIGDQRFSPLEGGRGHMGAGQGELLSTDPGEPQRVVARARSASTADVDAAVEVAAARQPAWGRQAAADRAAVLLGAAAWLRARRLTLAALQVRECAKPWVEADADVCEAIDFLEYYAREAVRVQERSVGLLQPPGERNELRLHARGVAAVISPWNFPLAIPTGMTAAALATGNAVVLKPAEQAPASAWMLWRALTEAGLPRGLLSLLPGAGDIGGALARHSGVHVIAFTGSQSVGLELLQVGANMAPGQLHIKRVIAELGGKNCVIVDADADLDEAVPAIVDSAFSYAGQKCSAASRVLVHEAVADRFERRLAGAVTPLVVGQASELTTQIPPLIEQAAQERVRSYTEQALSEGRLIARATYKMPPQGFFCTPTVVGDLPASSPVLREEVFGPLLTFERVTDVGQALELVAALPFALTCGVFCRDPATVAEVARSTSVGNLYVNRRITGAMVGRQPFGGNRLSGTGAQAGGPDYLQQFTEPRVICENTVRHGLVIPA
jgi:RHH-type proline utilization regulon transcriptional repressor/proline dehydrogenase/delta 1-pyrroline-5-carboxylate dehydrogenase